MSTWTTCASRLQTDSNRGSQSEGCDTACDVIANMERAQPPPHIGDYPDGVYLSAFMPDGSRIPEDSVEDYTVPGDTLRIMWDEDAGPLWAGGLLPDEPEWIRRALGVSDAFVSDLLGWWRDMLAFHDERLQPLEALRVLDDRGHQLAKRLQVEVGSRFAVSYRP